MCDCDKGGIGNFYTTVCSFCITGGDKGASTKAGVSQVLNRLTYASSLTHLRRCKQYAAGTYWKTGQTTSVAQYTLGNGVSGRDREGQAVGLIKNLALMAYITTGTAQVPVLEFLEEFSTENLTDILPSIIAEPNTCKIFVNGNWVGIRRNPKALVDTFRSLRRMIDIDAEVSIAQDIVVKEVRISTDAGCICRLLFVVQDQELAIKKHRISQLQGTNPDQKELTWADLLMEGLVKYIDTEEEIATDPKDLDSSESYSSYLHPLQDSPVHDSGSVRLHYSLSRSQPESL